MTDPRPAEDVWAADAHAARTRYEDRIRSIDDEIDRLTASDRRFGTARVVLFFLALALWAMGFFADPGTLLTAGGWTAIVGFLVVVICNEPVRERLDARKSRRRVVQRLRARLDRDWQTLHSPRIAEKLANLELDPRRREVAGDLDLFGKASLFQLLSMAATTPGVRTLARWLTEPVVPARAASRARAVDSLAERTEDRLQFYELASQVGESSGDPARFVEWASGERWLAGRPWLNLWANASLVLAVAALAAAVASGFGWLPEAAFRPSLFGLLGLGFLNLVGAGLVLGPAHEIFSVAMSSRRAVARYETLFGSARWLPDDDGTDPDGLLTEVREAMLDDQRGAVRGMRELARVARAGGLKQSAATFLVYLPLQAFALWDVRVLRRLEAWQQAYGKQTREWFDALGSLEALMSLAALRDEYPGWAMPRWRTPPDDAVVVAEAIGHPLLPDRDRVCNDVTVGPSGTLLLVTGSNMSGKSTMLRSVGLNVALASAGAPVCARSLELPPVELATSIRVSDDVSQGVSFYMAELHRLKSVVDHARSVAGPEGPSRDGLVQLYLLDEILQGTNSRERQIAVVRVLRTLLESGSIGAISTHDLELADEPELKSIAHTVHFRETIRPDAEGNEQMTFDYQMREGVSPTTNALRLLEMVGLGGDAERSSGNVARESAEES